MNELGDSEKAVEDMATTKSETNLARLPHWYAPTPLYLRIIRWMIVGGIVFWAAFIIAIVGWM